MSQVKLEKAPAYRWYMLIINMVAYGHFFMTIQTTAAFGSAISSSWGLSATALSLLTTATMISFALFGGFGGKLQTKYGPKKTVIIGMLLNIAASLVFIFAAKSYAAAIVLRFIQGISGGIMASSIVSGTSMWFPVKQRGLASGLLMGILGIGFSIATLGASAFLGAGIAWQTGLGLLVSVSGAVIVLIYAATVKEVSKVYPGAYSIAELLPQEAGAGSVSESRPKTLREAHRTKKFWAVAFFGFASGWLTYGFSAFLGTLLSSDLGITSGLVTTVISSTFFITIIASPLGGIISDNVFKGSRYQVLMIGAAITAVSLFVLPFVGANALIVAILLIFAYGSVSLPCGTFWATPNEIVDISIAGECTGEITAIANVGGVIVAPIISAIIDASGSSYIALYICVAFGVLSVIAARTIHQ